VNWRTEHVKLHDWRTKQRHFLFGKERRVWHQLFNYHTHVLGSAMQEGVAGTRYFATWQHQLVDQDTNLSKIRAATWKVWGTVWRADFRAFYVSLSIIVQGPNAHILNSKSEDWNAQTFSLKPSKSCVSFGKPRFFPCMYKSVLILDLGGAKSLQTCNNEHTQGNKLFPNTGRTDHTVSTHTWAPNCFGKTWFLSLRSKFLHKFLRPGKT
jgi:hypothetical protein